MLPNVRFASITKTIMAAYKMSLCQNIILCHAAEDILCPMHFAESIEPVTCLIKQCQKCKLYDKGIWKHLCIHVVIFAKPSSDVTRNHQPLLFIHPIPTAPGLGRHSGGSYYHLSMNCRQLLLLDQIDCAALDVSSNQLHQLMITI